MAHDAVNGDVKELLTFANFSLHKSKLEDIRLNLQLVGGYLPLSAVKFMYVSAVCDYSYIQAILIT
jgi:hypothetical protein